MNINKDELENKLSEILDQAAAARDEAQKTITMINDIKHWLVKQELKAIKG